MQINPSNPICGPPGRTLSAIVCLALAAALAPGLSADWVEFVDETATRLSAPAGVGADDPEEKDYAWGDIDRDGDLDLAVARKEPFTSAGKRTNVLLINESGVLTDRTADFATDSDVTGDNGFLTPTNDRDIGLVDVNNDGWLDVITTTAVSSGEPKHIGHPRIYMNQCCSVGGCGASSCSTDDWLGLKYEDARMPQMLSDSGQDGFNPCFCAINAGDVNGDGFADLWFADYDTACGDADFNDKLLLNCGTSGLPGCTGPGYFYDVTETNFILSASDFPVSAFGASGGVAKMNEDGINDLVKQFAGFVGVSFNTPGDQGTFETQTNPYSGSAYFVSVGELNNDGKLDIAVSDDGADRYLLNEGDGGDAIADFISHPFDFKHIGGIPGIEDASDDGFGGNNVIADLNKDGWNDVLIADVDVDVGGCSRRMHIYRNLAGTPGGHVDLEEQTTGSNCQNFQGNPPECIVASIPADELVGVHDVAVFDINGDDWYDLVVGRCDSTTVYMNVPAFGPGGAVPDGESVPGTQLTVHRAGSQLDLSWAESCKGYDDDYAIFKGTIGGNFTSHAPLACGTGGATFQSIDIPAENAYFLIAPLNSEFQGSLGRKTGNVERHSPSSCLPHNVSPCN